MLGSFSYPRKAAFPQPHPIAAIHPTRLWFRLLGQFRPKEVIESKRRTISCGLVSDHGYADRYLSVGTRIIKRRIFEFGKTVRQNISDEIRLPPCSGLGENLF